jgi:hypothetical protein
MGRPNSLSRIAKERGMTEEEVLTEALVTGGSIDQAATLLGLYPNSVRSALARHRLRFTREVVARVEKVATP